MVKKLFLVFMIMASASSGTLFAQQFTLFSSRWVDVGSKATSRTASIIYIDSNRITIEQGTSHLYLDIKSKERKESNFFYTVLDFNDEECHAGFSPEQMVFDYQSGGYHLKYYIDSLQQQQPESPETEESDDEAASDSTATDSIKEDTKVYLSADLPPEFPGGIEAMKAWLVEHTRYPAAAKKDKIMGLVEVTAVVEKNGSLSDIVIKHDIGGGCGDEAVRTVKQMPTWIPGQVKGEDKRVKVTIKVFFPPK